MQVAMRALEAGKRRQALAKAVVGVLGLQL